MFMFGCRRRNKINRPEEECGGKIVKTDPKAPKSIKSDDITFFETEFFRNEDDTYRNSGYYRFMLNKDENGSYTISGDKKEALKCETDREFATKLGKLIRDYGLIEQNGKYEVTSGLPPECGPFVLRAEYSSGERLWFTCDGDPDDKFTGAVLDLFAKEFGKHGIEEYLPPKEDSEYFESV